MEPLNLDTIKIDDFQKIQLKVGTIIGAMPHPNADKLMLLDVYLGEPGKTLRIVAGIAKHYTHSQMIHKQVIVVTNLEPVKLRGEESFGMLLAASDANCPTLSLLTPDKLMTPGSLVR